MGTHDTADTRPVLDSCTMPDKDCYESDPESSHFCSHRDDCPLYDIHLDHTRMDKLFWEYVVKNQGIEFHTARGLTFTYQIIKDEKGNELMKVSRAKHPYSQNAVLRGVDGERDDSYYGKPYIQPLAEEFLRRI